MPMRDVKLGLGVHDGRRRGGGDVEQAASSSSSEEKNASTRTGSMHEDYLELKWRAALVIEPPYQNRAIRLRGQGQFGNKVDEEVFSPFGNPEAATTWLVMSFAGRPARFTASRGFLLNVPELARQHLQPVVVTRRRCRGRRG